MLVPQRIQRDFEQLQFRSEIIVASLQIAVILFLLVLYYIAPKGFAPDSPVLSAPLGLSLFLVLVCVRFWFAYTNQLNRLFLAFSVIAEMSILLFTIWTYHLQYETFSTINLKNPHVNFVFVLIALRALRFEPIWVVLSGITACLGWLFIVWHALETTSMDIVTWDYVTYASSRSLNPAAEFIKILAILMVTAITALVLKRARETLFIAVSQTQHARDLSRFFDSSVATKITSAVDDAKSGFGEVRQAGILFCDLRSFSISSEHLSAPDLIALLNSYHGLVVPLIQKNNGSIDKYMGDGILASFGAVNPSQNYAADLLRAIEDILNAEEIWQNQRQDQGKLAPKIGLGASVGKVVFGIIGNEERLEYTVIGETVNIAAKLEKHNKAVKSRAIVTSDAVEKALEQGFKPNVSHKKIESVLVEGLSHKIDLEIIE